MKAGGKRTNENGIAFEIKAQIDETLLDESKYTLFGGEVFEDYQKIIYSYPQYNFYSDFIASRHIRWEKRISKRLIPDDAIFNVKNNTLYIIEKKYQEQSGSIDEKLQACTFRKEEFNKLLEGTDIKVHLIYILNDWFEKPEYKDILDYMKRNDIDYYFNSLPPEAIGL